MDPGGSDLDSSLPQPENPCLIVEDSQPDSVGLEDDPEGSYRALLARRLSSLQPAARSPVLELISSPPGSRCSQTDSQSESDNQAEPNVEAAAEPSAPLQEESQVIGICPPPSKKKFTPEDAEMDPGADSTTNCVQSDGGSSQFGFLELSQSQDLQASGDFKHCSEKLQGAGSKTSEHQDNKKAVRSDVISSSSSESLGQSGRPPSVQVLLHSQNRPDCEVLSSQEDLFDADKSGAAVHSTVSEPEQQAPPTSTPAETLRLLHLSGQGTLVQESLSQTSVDYVAPTPDSFAHIIIPSSPTEGDEPMDTLLPPEEGAPEKDEPMETEAGSRPRPLSAAAYKSSSGLGSDQALPVPSQPQFSHDVFVPTQSQEANQRSSALPSESQPPARESAPFATPLQLSVSADSSDPLPAEEDSQATQIEELHAPGVDASDAVISEPRAAELPNRLSRTEQNSDLKSLSDGQRAADAPSNTDANETLDTNHSDVDASSRVQETPCEERPQGAEEEEVVMEEEEVSGGASGIALVLSQSQLMSPEPMEDEQEDGPDQSRDGKTDAARSKAGVSVAVDSDRRQTQEEGADPASDGSSRGGEGGGVKDKCLSESSGEISFHFTLPKEGELIGSTPPLTNQLKQTLRHSTPIEIAPFSEKPGAVGDASVDVAAEGGEEDGKLSLRMKLVTPVEEGSSERFSLQRPALSEEDEAVATVTAVSKAACSASVFTRVRQVHRQQGAEEDVPAGNDAAVFRGELFASPQRSSQSSSLGCNSLPNSQYEPPEQDEPPASQNSRKEPHVPAGPPQKSRVQSEAPSLMPPLTNSVDAGQKEASPKTPDNATPSTPSNKSRRRNASQQSGFDGSRSPLGRGNAGGPESPPFRRTAAPNHRRHVRTVQEVRTTITRIITDVYYEDGREVDRRVTEENEEPVVDCQVLDGDLSPSRTGSSSLTSGDLGDISSLSSKASSLHHSSGAARPDFLMPPSRVFKSASPRRGDGHPQRGHRGHRAGSVVTVGRGGSTFGSRAFVPLTPRGRARRGRPPSRSPLSRGGGGSPLRRLAAQARTRTSSDDEPYPGALPPRPHTSPSGRSDSLRSSPEGLGSGGSFVGLRVVAKWSSNGYFYSGRIVRDAGDGRFRLRFDDGYECEVAGKDILLCDPIPVETEVTALLEDEYFSIGVVKGHKSEGQELFYSVEKDVQRQWYNRTAIILSLEQGNKLREQHSLGPYEPTTPLTKASDISLDNLVEGKRRRRGGTPGGTTNTPDCSSSSSPRTPGPSGKRKLMSSDESRTPSKRGRRGGGARAGTGIRPPGP